MAAELQKGRIMSDVLEALKKAREVLKKEGYINLVSEIDKALKAPEKKIFIDTPAGRITAVVGNDPGNPNISVCLTPINGDGDIIDLAYIETKSEDLLEESERPDDVFVYMYSDPYQEDCTHKAIIHHQDVMDAIGCTENTWIEYLYRDADNYKVWNEAVVSGVLTDEEKAQIEECLSEGEYFLPQQVGLPEKRFDEETVADHPWFELISIKNTNAPATGALTAKELLDNFLKAKDCWEPNT